MTIKLITNPQIWDSFIEESNYSTIFHKWEFLKIIAKHTKSDLRTYGFYNKGEKLYAVIPFFIKEIYLFKFIFSPPPATAIPYLGFVVENDFFVLKQYQKEKYLETIFNDFNEEVKKINPDYLSIILIPELFDARIFIWGNYKVDINYTYSLDISKEIDELFDGIQDKRRQKITKAIKINLIKVRTDNVELVYDMVNKRYKEQNLRGPIVNLEYLKDLEKTFPNNIFFNLVYYGDKVVGSEALLSFHDTQWNWIGSVRPEENYPVNEFLLWEAIKTGKERGIKNFDLVGANNKNISFFKSLFNPTLKIYYNITKKSSKGKMAEYIYFNLLKKNRLKFLK